MSSNTKPVNSIKQYQINEVTKFSKKLVAGNSYGYFFYVSIFSWN
jgi:hypothetical protein